MVIDADITVTAGAQVSRQTRLRWWIDGKPYALWRPGTILMCLLTGHEEMENVNVHRTWDTHCGWCGKGMKRHA